MKTNDATLTAPSRTAGGQLELILAPDAPPAPTPRPAPARPRPPRRPRRGGAARWWFDQMREVVRTAREWPAAEIPWGPDEQIDLALPTPPPVRFERRPPVPAPVPALAA